MKMAHLQYIPGDPRLVDQLVYELKSKGIFDQFRKDCIADVDTRPAYQNLRQRVENSVSTFLARQVWKPDLNKNQLREKLRKHILDGNYLEQGVERIVDQVVNPKVASVFIPQVEDLVYNYLGITRKKTTPVAETSNGKVNNNDLLPTDLEAVSPGSVKSNDDKNEEMDISENGEDMKMDVDEKDGSKYVKEEVDKVKADQDTQLSGISELTSNDSGSLDKSSIPLPSEEIKLENIPAPENSPPKATKVKVELENIQLPLEPNLSTDIPLPEEAPKLESEHYFKPVNSDDDDSSSDSSLIRNMSPLTPIRNFINENSCDAQQAFESEVVDSKSDDIKETGEPSTFRFAIEPKTENSSDVKTEKKETEALSYQFNNQVNINTFNTPMYEDSSNSNHLQIDYESDASKNNNENKVPEPDHNSEDSRKDKKSDDKKSSHRSSHHRDSHRHSSSKDRKSDSKQSSSKDSKSDKRSSKDDHKSSSKSSSHKDKPSEKSDKKDSRDPSKHRSSSSHKSSSSSSHRDSKSHRSSNSSQRHSSSSKHGDDKKSSSSSHKDKSDKSSDKYSKEKSSKDSKSSSSSHRSEKDRKSSSSSRSKSDDKDKQKKDKKETDDHYSASGRGNHTRRSTDRDSNDGSSSSKGSHNPTNSKPSEAKKDSKGSTSKSDNTPTSDSASPSDKDHTVTEMKSNGQSVPQVKPVVRIENHLEVPISSPPRLPFVPDVTLKKPKFAANMQEARKLMKMRKFLDEEQKRMNQEAALLLEFQANVRPSLSQVYSNIPGPELEFACVTSAPRELIAESQTETLPESVQGNGQADSSESRSDTISDILTAAQQVEDIGANAIDRQEVIVETVQDTETVIEEEIENEADEISNKATVKIENIEEANLGEANMEVDTMDERNIKIVEVSPSNDVKNNEVASDDKETVINIEITDDVFSNGNGVADDGIERRLQSLMEDDHNTHTEYFQVTIITEELSESEDVDPDPIMITNKEEVCSDEKPFTYFGEQEKLSAEIERDAFSKFLKSFVDKTACQKIYLVNCDTYEENILKEVSENFGRFEIVNYYRNGRLKLNSSSKNIVRNVNVDSEISLPTNINGDKSPIPIFSPVKSECSFELSSDYDAKLEEMVSKTSRKEIMEIILGNAADGCAAEPTEMPTIDYCNESSIESDSENTLKRKYCEVGSSFNNNRRVLTPNKIRKLSGSDQISSTTEESEETSNNNVVSNPIRSKYLGRARRVGLPRPKRSSNLPNSPSSDKSVENYEENGQATQPNGKLKVPRNKVQRYDTSDLYKPKLHYLSRRNNIS